MHFLVFLIIWLWIFGSGGLFIGLLCGLWVDVFTKKMYYTAPVYLAFLLVSGATFWWSFGLFLKLYNS